MGRAIIDHSLSILLSLNTKRFQSLVNSYNNKEQRWLMKQKQVFSYNFLAIAILAFLSCPDRSDYNLPFALFAYLLWNYRTYPQKHRIIWVLFISVFCDALWLLTVSIAQWTEDTQGNQLRGLTQILSLISLCYKIVMITYAVLSINECSNLFSIDSFRKQVLYRQ